ncbi:hypothetical protein TorRG33x02_145790 [Trema orientale]|uniref:Uncharacterized protein n=1 Tax=Trema orientale TaxID=63057 RepID=A0A2P5EVN6_TREOI|nr:hypothetical protein TorRG33x02_145790 [Trema orientale]
MIAVWPFLLDEPLSFLGCTIDDYNILVMLAVLVWVEMPSGKRLITIVTVQLRKNLKPWSQIKWQHLRRKAELKSKLEATLLQQHARAILNSRFNFQLAFISNSWHIFRTAGADS